MFTIDNYVLSESESVTKVGDSASKAGSFVLFSRTCSQRACGGHGKLPG